jgi:hypothetical protein
VIGFYYRKCRTFFDLCFGAYFLLCKKSVDNTLIFNGISSFVFLFIGRIQCSGSLEIGCRGGFRNLGGVISAHNVTIGAGRGFVSEFGNISAAGSLTVNGDLIDR